MPSLFPVLWAGLGLLGTTIMLSKGSKVPGRTIAMALFSLPHAVIFGPLFLLLTLSAQSVKPCPFCCSRIPEAAVVCPKCTRSIGEESGDSPKFRGRVE